MSPLRIVIPTTIVVLGLIAMSFFTVDVTEMAVVTQFGNPVAVVTDPDCGRRSRSCSRCAGSMRACGSWSRQQSEFLTNDKKNVVVNWFVVWRIGDPLRYFRAMPSEAAARSQITDVDLVAARGGPRLDCRIQLAHQHGCPSSVASSGDGRMGSRTR